MSPAALPYPDTFTSRRQYHLSLSLAEGGYDRCATLIGAFTGYVTKTDNCWLWTGPLAGNGYGVMVHRGRRWLAHRLSVVLHMGPIPPGKLVCHACDIPICVNPDHLWIGSHRENSRDAVAKGRMHQGDAHPLRVLSEAVIPKIRQLGAEGMSGKDIARQFGVHPNAIYNVLNGKTWAHVQ